MTREDIYICAAAMHINFKSLIKTVNQWFLFCLLRVPADGQLSGLYRLPSHQEAVTSAAWAWPSLERDKTQQSLNALMGRMGSGGRGEQEDDVAEAEMEERVADRSGEA